MKKVLVIGDTLIDSYVLGDVDRISPEAPIPVFDVQDQYKRLGGAAYVASNISSLYEEDLAIHYCGFYSREVIELMENLGSSSYGVKISPIGTYLNSEEILEKKRFVSDRYQLLRVDNKRGYNKEHIQEFSTFVDSIKFDQYDLVVVSDYNKGTLSPKIYSLLEDQKDTKILIEAKTAGVGHFGDNVIYKCNDKEFVYTTLLHSYKEMVVTMGGKGFRLMKSENTFPALEKESEVVDVVGCGDAFLAGMAVNFLETGEFDAKAMAQFGNKVAGKKALVFGTVPIKREWL